MALAGTTGGRSIWRGQREPAEQIKCESFFLGGWTQLMLDNKLCRQAAGLCRQAVPAMSQRPSGMSQAGICRHQGSLTFA